MTVLLVRPDRNEADAQALRAVGLEPWIDPYLRVGPAADPTGARDLLAALQAAGVGTWLVVTSPRAVPAWAGTVGADALTEAIAGAVGRGLRLAAVGTATARALPTDAPVLVPDRATAADLVMALRGQVGAGPGTALVPAGDRARPELGAGLGDAGWQVLDRVVYRTEPVADPPSAGALARGEVDAVLLRSPSAVAAVLAHQVPAATLLVAVGPTTAAALAATGREHLVADGEPDEVAAAVASALATRS